MKNGIKKGFSSFVMLSGIMSIVFLAVFLCANIVGISFASATPVASDGERPAPAGVPAANLQAAQDSKAALVEAKNGASSYINAFSGSDTYTDTGTSVSAPTDTPDTSTDISTYTGSGTSTSTGSGTSTSTGSDTSTSTGSDTGTYTGSGTSTSTGSDTGTSTGSDTFTGSATSTDTSTSTSTATSDKVQPAPTSKIPPALKSTLEMVDKFMKNFTELKPATDKNPVPAGTSPYQGYCPGPDRYTTFQSWEMGKGPSFLTYCYQLFCNWAWAAPISNGRTRVTIITEVDPSTGKVTKRTIIEDENKKIEFEGAGDSTYRPRSARVTDKNTGESVTITDTNGDGVGDKSTPVPAP